jgi:hypothetical protein
MSLEATKSNIIRELFVRTADENYITARWCALNNFYTDFLWLSLHALEKYLKAVLLANGRTSKVDAAGQLYKHGIDRLYADVKVIAGSLLPDQMTKPASLNNSYWVDRSAVEFIAHLSRNGNADNRYLLYGYVTHSQDLYMLDQIVFSVRRLICPLDNIIPFGNGTISATITFREALTKNPQYYARMFMPLDNIIFSPSQAYDTFSTSGPFRRLWTAVVLTVRHCFCAAETSAGDDASPRTAVLNGNWAFAPPGFPHTPLREGSSARNPAILRYVLEPLGSTDPHHAAEGIKVAEWLLDNVVIPKGPAGEPGLQDQIKQAIKDAKTRLGTR